MNTLIIEDSDCAALLLTKRLRKEWPDSFIQVAPSAKLALDGCGFDLIFLDNELGDGLGVDIAPMIRYRNPDAVIIFLSASTSNQDRLRGIVNAICSKPFTKRHASILKNWMQGERHAR